MNWLGIYRPILLFCSRVKQPLDQILGRSVDELKTTSPQGSVSPGTPSAPIDRAAAKRAELRRMEQERRRREAVSGVAFPFSFSLFSATEINQHQILIFVQQLQGQIDMNMQSDLMAAFEESLEKERK